MITLRCSVTLVNPMVSVESGNLITVVMQKKVSALPLIDQCVTHTNPILTWQVLGIAYLIDQDVFHAISHTISCINVEEFEKLLEKYHEAGYLIATTEVLDKLDKEAE